MFGDFVFYLTLPGLYALLPALMCMTHVRFCNKKLDILNNTPSNPARKVFPVFVTNSYIDNSRNKQGTTVGTTVYIGTTSKRGQGICEF